MKAKVQYGDFVGTVAADIDDHLGRSHGDNLQGIAKYFKLDENRFKIVGLSIYGTENQYISMICVDLEKSTDDNEHIVSMSYDVEGFKPVLDHLFKRLHIMLHDRHDKKYINLDYVEEVNYSDYHETEEE
jgi:hypothetical protein